MNIRISSMLLAATLFGFVAVGVRPTVAHATPSHLLPMLVLQSDLPKTALKRPQLKEYLGIAKEGTINGGISEDTFETLGDLIDRFFDAPGELSRTEKLMLATFFDDAKAWFDAAENDELGGPRDPAPRGTSAMFAASTAATTAPSTPKPTTPKPATPKVRVPGVHVKPVFTSGARSGIGYVRLTISGRSKEIIQIRASAGGKDLTRRATMIRDRFRAAQSSSGLWWSRLYIAKDKGEWVVRSRSYKTVFLVTADANWAKARGLTTQQLAGAIMHDIRRTMDE